MKISIFIFYFIFIIISSPLYGNEVTDWLKKEIDIILNAYQNENLPNENRFLMVEQTINNNFAGAGIAKFVSGKSWNSADKETKKDQFSKEINSLGYEVSYGGRFLHLCERRCPHLRQLLGRMPRSPESPGVHCSSL